MLKQDRLLDDEGIPKPIQPFRARLERRTHTRQTALLRVAVLHAGGARDLCVVKNIAPNGLSARAYRKLASAEQVQIEFKSGELLSGSVVWERDWDVGIIFPKPIDVEAVLASRWVTETARRRNLPRIAISSKGRLKAGLQSFEVTLQDISQGGARVQAEMSSIDRGEVLLSLPGLPPIAGVVRWVGGTEVGVSFNECIAFETLARWIHGHRAKAPD
jgi:hypothetical protein